jgi:predicted P-loop ATPase
LKEAITPEQWRSITTRLIQHCKADPACKNPARVMRLPGSVYHDKKTGKATGKCRIIAASGALYEAEDIEQCLPPEAQPKAVKDDAKGLSVASPKKQRMPSKAITDKKWEPLGVDEINAAAEYIPRRIGGEGTYEQDRNALCGCSAALTEAGVPDGDAAALALLGHKWPTEADARQVLESTKTRNPAAFWAIAREHGYRFPDKSRDLSQTGSITRKPQSKGNGKSIRLKPNQVLELLPERVGVLRLNTRSNDITADGKLLGRNTIDRLYLELSSEEETWSKQTTTDAVITLAERNQFDPVAEYLNSISGDLLPMEQWQRLDQHLLGIDDPIAAEFLPRYFISAVARVFQPGADVRQCPVLVGPQWRGKTVLGRILFGDANWISGVGDLERDAIDRMHTAWGVELAELDGITRRSDQEALKQFLTETCDVYRKPYDRCSERHPRRFVFWATSNGAALRDTTGNTRFVTIPIPDRMLPLEWAEEHRNSLWARAVEQYRAGVQWDRCSDEMRDAIADRNANYTEQDPWHDRIAQVLKRKALELQLPVQVADLLEAVEVPVERQRKQEGQRVRQIAESLGWVMARRKTSNSSNAEGKARGLWPPERGHNKTQQDTTGDTTPDPSDCRASAPQDTTDISNRGKGKTQAAGRTPPDTHHQQNGVFNPLHAFVVSDVSGSSDPLQCNGSGQTQHPKSVVSGDVSVVSGDVSLGSPGSSWDTDADGDDPHWPKRREAA